MNQLEIVVCRSNGEDIFCRGFIKRFANGIGENNCCWMIRLDVHQSPWNIPAAEKLELV